MEKSPDSKNWDTGLYYYILLFMNYVETKLRIAWKENWYILSNVWSSDSAAFK